MGNRFKISTNALLVAIITCYATLLFSPGTSFSEETLEIDEAKIYSGTILEKGWNKSYQSFCAGGSEHYILKTEEREYILASTRDSNVSWEKKLEMHQHLKEMEGKKAEIMGFYITLKADSEDICPPMTQCLLPIVLGTDSENKKIVCSWIRIKSIHILDQNIVE